MLILAQNQLLDLAYAFYGLAFFSLGLAVGMRAAVCRETSLRRRMLALAAFGILHGSFEWTILLSLAEQWPVPPALSLGLGALSFGPLFYFGLASLNLAPLRIWAAIAGVLALWALCALFAGGGPLTADLLLRLWVAIPAALLAAYAFAFDPVLRPDGTKCHRSLRVATAAFLAYAGLQTYSAAWGAVLIQNGDTAFAAAVGPLCLFLRAVVGLVILAATIGVLNALDENRRRLEAEASAKTEIALATVEERHRQLIDVLNAAHAFVGIFQHDGTMIFTSERPLSRWGLTLDAVIGKHVRDMPWWADSPASTALIEETLDAVRAGDTIRYSAEVQASTGEFRMLEFTHMPLRDPSGAVVEILGFATDVTARARAARAQQDSEGRLEKILESEPECVKTLNAEGTLLYMNPAGLRMIGAKTPADVCGKSILNVIGEEYHEAFRTEIDAVFSGKTSRLVFEVESLDGRRRWVEQHSVPLRSAKANGQIVEMLAVTRDIHERVEAERALTESNRRLQMAQRIGNMGYWSWNPRTNFRIWSDQTYRILALDPDTAKPGLRAFLERVHPDDRDRFEIEYNAMRDVGAPLFVDVRLVLPNGEIRIANLQGEATYGSNGNVLEVTGVLQDVTQWRAVQEAERQTRNTLMGILQISPEAVIVTDAQMRITLFSQGATTIFGYAPDEVMGRTIECLLPERLRTTHAALVAGFAAAPANNRRMGERSEIVGLRKNGEEFPAEASISRLETTDGQVFTSILRDVTKTKAAADELLQAKRRAEAASEAKSRFLANMSHELRTPLNAIIGFSEILEKEVFGSVGGLKNLEYVRDISSSGRHLLNLINDILDVTRIEIGKTSLAEEEFELDDLVQSCVRMVREHAGDAGIQLNDELAGEHPNVVGDRRLLSQVLLNLLSNALKFTPRGGSVTVSSIQTESGGLALSVVDTGIGMSADALARIGEPFTQGESALNRKYEGAGLGLAISTGLVELHGGTLRVESTPGEGTKAIIELPPARLRSRTAA